EPQVRLGEARLGGLVARARASGQLAFLLPCEQRDRHDFLQVDSEVLAARRTRFLADVAVLRVDERVEWLVRDGFLGLVTHAVARLSPRSGRCGAASGAGRADYRQARRATTYHVHFEVRRDGLAYN